MVYVLDLEEESPDPAIHDNVYSPHAELVGQQDDNVDITQNVNVFSAALACYP